MRKRTFTLEPERESWRVHAAVAACITVVSALTLWAAGCGDSSHAEDRTADAVTTTPTPAGAPAPVERAPAPTVVTGPVSFTDARSAFRAQRYDEAVTLFTIYTGEHPEDAAGFSLLGLSQWKSGHHDLAVPALEHAIALDSTRLAPYYNLTRVLLESGKPQEALTWIEQAISRDSTKGEGWRLLARTRADLGRVPEASDGYARAIGLDASDAWSMNNLALLYLDEGRYTDALPPLARAVELSPGSATFQNNLGMALERSGYFAAAADAYRNAIAADSSFAKASVNLARVDGKTDVPDLPPLDLSALARSFVERNK